jgi:Concanavalin A-like lectin/glucanases superfamily
VPRKLILATAVAVALSTPAPAGAQAVDSRLSYVAPDTETGTVAIDESGHGNDGVLKGGVTRVHGVYKFHRLSRDHRYDRIQAPDDASLSPGLSPFTYSVRLKVSPTAEWSHSEMAVIRHGDTDSGGGNYKMELGKNAKTGAVWVFCVMHDDDESGIGYIRGRGGLKSIADGHWHTVACSRVDADTVSLTVDGHVVEHATRGDLGNVASSVPLLIGCQLRGQGPTRREQFVGKMDDISITVN